MTSSAASGSIHDTDRAKVALGVWQTAKAARSVLEAWSPLYLGRRAKARQVQALTGAVEAAHTELADALFVARVKAELERHSTAEVQLIEIVADLEVNLRAVINRTHSDNLRAIRRQFSA